VYNTSKAAVNSVTAHYSLKLKKKPGRVLSLCPGYNSTAATGYNEHAQDPTIGAAGVVDAILAQPDSQYQTGQFWNYKGERLQW
jgi:NAD(P)-dependent dehydrogenase (short-subunit alcohol dehydrogenase family)